MRLLLLLLTALMLPLTDAGAQVTEAGKASGVLTTVPAGQSRTLSADTLYTITGVVFVEDGATLSIEAGTILKFDEGQNFDASALVVARGGRLLAEGSATQPIILTSVLDDLDDPTDLLQDVIGIDYPVPVRGLWGGLVLLGRATTNNSGTNAEKEIEGLNQIFPGDTRIRYGGSDDEDDSGVLRYVSIRHSGINVGDATSGNEIQGLTLGAIGRGTTIEYVESYGSNDDGFEWFGGTVNTKYLVSAFNADDAFDTDEGFRGKGQFWFALQAGDDKGSAAEMDGATGDEYFQPYSTPVIYNATYIGPGASAPTSGDNSGALVNIRDNSAASYFASIFTEAPYGAILVEDIDNTGAKTEDSRKRLEAAELKLEGNLWYGFGAGNTVAEFAAQDFVQTYLAGADQRVMDPMLRSVSRDVEGLLDPRPAVGSPALTSVRAAPDDGFFTPVAFTGAFGADLWTGGWTALDGLGYTATAVEQIGKAPGALTLEQSHPNPASGGTTIDFTLDRTQSVHLALYDLTGREVAVLVEGVRAAGTTRATFDASSLAPGVYVYRLSTERGTHNRTLLVVR